LGVRPSADQGIAGRRPGVIQYMENNNIPPGDTEPSETTQGVVPWPEPISDVGKWGLAGDFVELVAPRTEADPNALLLTFLVVAGHVIGRRFYLPGGGRKHYTNEYLCLVGPTALGRKETAIAAVEAFFSEGPYPCGFGNVLYGLSTGEGLIWEIRDQIIKEQRDKTTQKIEEVEVAPGVSDKRLLIMLGEFYQAITAMRRKENTLSSVLRLAWDKDRLSAPAKNSAAKATGAHISLVAGISRNELLSAVNNADSENGTLNRILWACTRRSKPLPEGDTLHDLIESSCWGKLQQRFNRNIDIDDTGAQIKLTRTPDAQDDWGRNDQPDRGLYKKLTQSRVGIWGSVTARAAQHVMRLSVIQTIINGLREIGMDAQDAAAEDWRYADDSSQFIYAPSYDPVAETILERLRNVSPAGLTRTDIFNLWKGHKPAEEIETALKKLAAAGVARFHQAKGKTRPKEVWAA
jgi:hypothetical protein